MHVAAFSACEEFGGGGGSWIDQALDWVHRQLESSCYDLPDWGDKSLKETYFDWDCFLEKNFKAWEKLPTSYPPSGYH